MMRDAEKTAAAAAAAAVTGTTATEGFPGAPPVEAPVPAPAPTVTAPAARAVTDAPASPTVVAARLAAEAAASVTPVTATVTAPTPPNPTPVVPAETPPVMATPTPADAFPPTLVAAPEAPTVEPAPITAPSPAPAAAAAAMPIDAQPALFKTRHYGASGLRKTVLSFVFLLMLPFYGSLGPMLVQRVGKVPLDDFVGFVLMALAFTAVMLLILFELMISLRSTLTLGPSAVRFTLPARGGLVPTFAYASHEIPYAAIDYVEVRREVYGGAWAPVLLRGARIVTKDGQKLSLGYVSEANDDAIIPFGEVADEIANRIGRPIVDRGSVRRQVRKKMMGVAAGADENKPLEDSEIKALNGAHRRFVMGLVAVLLVLLAAGVTRDILTMTEDAGERATNVQPKKTRG
jgi:hypothetical protein